LCKSRDEISPPRVEPALTDAPPQRIHPLTVIERRFAVLGQDYMGAQDKVQRWIEHRLGSEPNMPEDVAGIVAANELSPRLTTSWLDKVNLVISKKP
jgi:hypothetical protein